jgi:hypothetical protein
MRKVPIALFTVFLSISFFVSLTYCDNTDNQAILWQKMYGGINRDDPSSIVAHPDSGYVVVSSYQYKPNLSNIWLMRLGSKGDTLWTKSYGDSLRNETPVHLDIIPDGYIITGCIQDASTEKKVWLIKCDRNGDTVWSRIYHKKNATSSCITTDSAIVMTGQADTMLFLMKVSCSGDSVFCKTKGNKAQNLFGNTIIQTFDSGFIVSGQAKTALSKPSIIVYKFNNKGDSIWARTSSPANGSMGNDIVQLPDGSFLLAGSRSSTEAGNTRSFLRMLSPSGDPVWEKINGDDSLTETIQKIVAIDKGYICTAGTKVGSKSATIIIRGFTLNGESVASREFGNFSSTQTINFCKDAVLSGKGSIVIASFTQPEQGGQTLLFEVAYTNGITRQHHTPTQYHHFISTPYYFNLLGKRVSSPNTSKVFCCGLIIKETRNSTTIISSLH